MGICYFFLCAHAYVCIYLRKDKTRLDSTMYICYLSKLGPNFLKLSKHLFICGIIDRKAQKHLLNGL